MTAQNPRPHPQIRAVPPGLTDDDFDDMYRSMWPVQVRVAALILGSTAAAEDVVQDAFAAVYRHWPNMRDLPGAHAYARTAVINAARSVQRHDNVARTYLRRHHLCHASPADQELLTAETGRELLGALSRLPRSQREVLVLRYYARQSEAEIAATLHIARGTVKAHASRGLAALQKALKEQS